MPLAHPRTRKSPVSQTLAAHSIRHRMAHRLWIGITPTRCKAMHSKINWEYSIMRHSHPLVLLEPVPISVAANTTKSKLDKPSSISSRWRRGRTWQESWWPRQLTRQTGKLSHMRGLTVTVLTPGSMSLAPLFHSSLRQVQTTTRFLSSQCHRSKQWPTFQTS